MPPPAAVTVSEPPAITPIWSEYVAPSQSNFDSPSRSQSYDAKVSLLIIFLRLTSNLIDFFFLSSHEQPDLEVENARLESELSEAREKIRNLELQVEAIRANARKAAQTLLNG